MTARRAALLLACLAPAASGCIAAAIPLAAGGVLAKGRLDAARPSAAPARSSAHGDLKLTRLPLTELPPPDAMAAARNASVAALRDYALAEIAKPTIAGKRASALLSRAPELRAERATCLPAAPAAVFVDLDPGRAAFDPFAPGQADPVLAEVLAELRAEGVMVVWFSRLGAGFEAATRSALAETGLDPANADRLVLLNDLDERKQSRRDELAKQLCPIALLGDERADFDELYLYLKQSDAALALDALIGRGWFLASPFATATATTGGTAP